MDENEKVVPQEEETPTAPTAPSEEKEPEEIE